MSNLFRKKSISQIQKDVAESGGNAHGSGGLAKQLGFYDLTAFGIAAIIGAGIFSTIGQASYDGGPGVVFLFLFTAIACSFAAFCYAEFASMVPVSGSAYTYSYVAFGEIFAWIIGWALIMEYAIGNITVAISWSDYFTSLLEGFGVFIPRHWTMDYLSASKGFNEAQLLLKGGKAFDALPKNIQEAHSAWIFAPKLGGIRCILDIPALFIIFVITCVVYIGIKESRIMSNIMVVIKLAVVLLVIAVGIFYVQPANWSPFAPNGVSGILKGVSAVFFAYIGFDAISTTAEECKDPQRDLPRSMMWSIIICTILYVLIALVLTGMVKYDTLNVGDPLALVFKGRGPWFMSGIIAVSAVVAMASVLLVFQLGQPRIWMSMSRDGLLPKAFSRVHPRFKTPSFATIVTGFVVAIPALFLNLTMVTDLCSIGTLFAFVLVCGGILVLQDRKDFNRGKFKTPFINAKYVLPIMFLLGGFLIAFYAKDEAIGFLTNRAQPIAASDLIGNLSEEDVRDLKNFTASYDLEGFKAQQNDLESYITTISVEQYSNYIKTAPLGDNKKINSGFHLFKHKIPMWIFIFTCFALLYYSIRKNLSLIPVLGVISCLYLMAQIELKNWIGFTVWLLVGLVIYFSYGRSHSKLGKSELGLFEKI
jgi:basic amino acid/polyamine antiporter, APA family